MHPLRAVRCDEPPPLWPRRKLPRAVDRAVLDEGDAAVRQRVAVQVRHAKHVRPHAHAGIGLHEIIVRHARHRHPLTAVPIFELGDRVAMVANLHSRPPLIAAVFEVIGDRAGEGRADDAPRDRHTPFDRIIDHGKRLAAQIEMPGQALRAQIDDAHDDAASRAIDLHVSAAVRGSAVFLGIQCGDH